MIWIDGVNVVVQSKKLPSKTLRNQVVYSFDGPPDLKNGVLIFYI